MEVYQNEFFSLIQEPENNTLYIKVSRDGFHILNFNKLIQENPRIHVSEFLVLKDSLQNADNSQKMIGILRPEIDCYVTEDEMQAKAIVYLSPEELEKNRNVVIENIKAKLKGLGVLPGLINDAAIMNIESMVTTVVAEGLDVKDGQNATITYIEKPNRKPKISEDGSADFFNMNFFVQVKKGDILAEKSSSTKGIPGKTVIGKEIRCKSGQDQPFQYDKRTVTEVMESGRPVLKALRDGIVEFEDGKIKIGNHLFINGDVGIETGNIVFDGSVTIKGTVQPNFSVEAKNDISIMSELGVSNCTLIKSHEGDIFIKGGVFGNNITNVEAGRNIFVKHANECKMTASNDIYIAFYAGSCLIQARHIKMDERKGKIIGGRLFAEGSIVCAQIGNRVERETFVYVSGFNRESLERDLKRTLIQYKEKVNAKNKYQIALNVLKSRIQSRNDEQIRQLQEQFDRIVIEIMELEHQRKIFTSLLAVKGEGAVTAIKSFFPNTHVEIKGRKKTLMSQTKGTFYYKDFLLTQE